MQRLRRRALDLIWWLLGSLAGQLLITVRLADGSRLRLPLGSRIGFTLWLTRQFEPHEVAFVRGLLRSGQIVCDIGANVGYYTVQMARWVGPTGHIYAFEPDARNLARLRANLALNDLHNVTVMPCALSDRAGTATLTVARDGALTTLGTDTGAELEPVISQQTVTTRTLDSALASACVAQVDFVKLDVQGAERLVLAGARRTLGQAAPLVLLFETYDPGSAQFGYSGADLVRDVAGHACTLYRLDADGRWCAALPLPPHAPDAVLNYVAVTPARVAGSDSAPPAPVPAPPLSSARRSDY
jgi:FkbM family methyltransferase